MLNIIRRFTPTQWLILGIATAGFLNASTAQLTEWFGPKVAHNIITGLGFAQGLVGCWIAALTGQGSLIRAVAAMPGVESIQVNAKANSTLAAIAVDPEQKNVEPTPQSEAKVVSIARAG